MRNEDQDVDTRVERLNDDLVEDGMPEDEAARVAEQAAAIGDVRRGSRVRAPRNTQLPGEEDDDDEDGQGVGAACFDVSCLSSCWSCAVW